MGLSLRVKTLTNETPHFINKILYFFSITKFHPRDLINGYVPTITRSLSSIGTSNLSAANTPTSISTASKYATPSINQVLSTETSTYSCSQWYICFYARDSHIMIFSSENAKTAKDISNRSPCYWHTCCSPCVTNIQPTKP